MKTVVVLFATVLCAARLANCFDPFGPLHNLHDINKPIATTKPPPITTTAAVSHPPQPEKPAGEHLDYTWIGFGEREAHDEPVVWDRRIANSSTILTHNLTFNYSHFRFTFANLTLTDNFDKVIHNFDENQSSTEILFGNVTTSMAQIIVYGVLHSANRTANQGPKKAMRFTFTNSRKSSDF